MKIRKKYIIIFIILLVVLVGSFCVYKTINEKFKAERRHRGPSSTEPYKKKDELKDGFGDEDNIELKYDDYVVASGYAGASDNVYYTRNNVLYHLRLSTNETTRIAEGVKKIEESMDSLYVYKGNGFRIITEDDYIKYK